MSIIKALENNLRELARRNQTFRKLARSGRTRLMKARFSSARKGDLDEELIFFTSFAGRNYADSPKAIYEYMLANENYSNYSFIWMFQNPEEYGFLENNRNTRIVKQNSIEEAKAVAEAKYWITNYRMLDQFVPTEEQVYVQCWHGTPLKKLGYDLTSTENAMNDLEEIRDKYRTDAERFKYLLSPAPITTERLVSAWNLKETGKESAIIEEGYPRNDRLAKADAKEMMEIRERLGIEPDQKVILYAPTWRDNQFDSSKGYTYATELDFERLLGYLGSKYVILFRAHYLVANAFDFNKYEGKVKDVSQVDDINDLMLASDMLLTDYSSAMYDYAILKKPMVFYMYDLGEYKDSIRGLYTGLDELPGPIITNEDELYQTIKDVIGNEMPPSIPREYVDKYEAFNIKYNCKNDGCATARVVERVFNG